MEKDKIIELSLALAFVGILLIVSIIVLNDYNKEAQQSLSSQTINSYAVYNNYKIEYTVIPQTTNREKRDYYDYWIKDIYNSNYREYSDQKVRKEFLGNYVQEYYVYILNKERTGRYFTVMFNFEDKNGYEYSESITKYIRAGEKKKFDYRDIQYERNEIVDWDYEVILERS